MKRITNNDIAHKIAYELFKVSSGPSADRLVLERDKQLLCGWGFEPARDAIQRVLERELKRRQRQRTAKEKQS